MHESVEGIGNRHGCTARYVDEMHYLQMSK